MRGDIFGEGQRSADDVFVEEVDVVAFGVRWVVIERKVACKHGILKSHKSQLRGQQRRSRF